MKAAKKPAAKPTPDARIAGPTVSARVETATKVLRLAFAAAMLVARTDDDEWDDTCDDVTREELADACASAIGEALDELYWLDKNTCPEALDAVAPTDDQLQQGGAR